MKKLKKFTAIILVAIVVTFSLTAGLNKSYAWIVNRGKDIDLVKEHEPPIYGQQTDKYKFYFNPAEILEIYSLNSTGGDANFKYVVPSDQEGLVPVKNYNAEKQLANSRGEGPWSDGILDARDASTFLGALSSALANYTEVDEVKTIDEGNNEFRERCLSFSCSLAEYLNINSDDIVVYVTVMYPEVDGITSEVESYAINTETGITDEIVKKAEKFLEYNRVVARAYTKKKLLANGTKEEDADYEELLEEYSKKFLREATQQSIAVEAVTPDKTHYRLVCGNDRNFYLERTYQETPIKEEKPEEFKTELSYIATTDKNEKMDGKMDSDGKTFLPPYYDNDNSKKDTDAIATIKSKTKEDIVKVNGVDMNADGSANSEGWYYADVNNKKEISKKYEFDAYDNITYNGIVNQIVKVEGSEQGTDSQSVQIKWTFRRTKNETTENSDGSIKITLTYNLPIDTTKIPEGWEPIYDDAEKTTCHRITKTIKKGENYEKDVTVYQNGTGVPNTTHVVKIWKIPQAGESFTLLVAIAAIGVALIITHKKIKRK